MTKSDLKATVLERGQVTIPKPLRRKLGISAGTVLRFESEGGKLVAFKETPEEDPVTRVKGVIRSRKSSDRIITELRGRT